MKAARLFSAIVLAGTSVVCCSSPIAAPTPTICALTLAFQRPPDEVIDSSRAGTTPAISHEQAVAYAKDTNWAGAAGIWIPLPPDGRVTWGTSTVGSKFPVWLTASGTVTATARRIDGSTPPGVKGEFNGGNPSGQGPGFNASAITFPTNGCWEVTYRAGEGSLTFVVNVAHD